MYAILSVSIALFVTVTLSVIYVVAHATSLLSLGLPV